MRIIIAPDKFKGSLSAFEVAGHLAAGLSAGRPGLDEIIQVPVGDGGEGTLDAAIAAGYTRHNLTVTGPTGLPQPADYAIRGTEAVIEMATASGLAALPNGDLAALAATSRGTGELITAALDAGATTIILGVGGSACTDGGAGLLRALGAKMFDQNHKRLPDGGGALAQIAEVELDTLDPRIPATRFILASDVDNPLLGPNGAAEIFAPQKGATPADVTALEHGLECYFRVLANTIGTDAVTAEGTPGAGAAGGVGYAAIAVLKAERRPGIDVVLDLVGLAAKLVGADLVITGEGSLDTQSLAGKTPIGVARAAAKAGITTIAVAGRSTLETSVLHGAGISAAYTLAGLEPDPDKSMANAGALLEELGTQIGQTFPISDGTKEYNHA